MTDTIRIPRTKLKVREGNVRSRAPCESNPMDRIGWVPVYSKAARAGIGETTTAEIASSNERCVKR
jgi:hypothetical protein